MYTNRKVYLCNAILVTDIFCFFYIQQPLTPPSKNIFATKFGDRFSNLLRNKHTKLYPDLFRFDISIVRCLQGAAKK